MCSGHELLLVSMDHIEQVDFTYMQEISPVVVNKKTPPQKRSSRSLVCVTLPPGKW